MEEQKSYRTLEDIEARKDEIRLQLRQSDKQMKEMWHSLFRKPDSLASLSPTRRITSLLSNSATVVDGLILTWKLYRKFKKKRR